jgi:hypothetical protein
MSTGTSRYADVSSLINDIYEGSYFTLRTNNRLVRTVSVLSGSGMAPRKATINASSNPREVSEGDDVTPTQFNKTLLATLTPARHADQFLITDQRIETDSDNVRQDASIELGGGFAEYVDTKLATLFTSLTGGAVGAGGSALTWATIFQARTLLEVNKVPGPYFCALNPYGWYDLVNAATLAGTELKDAPGFQDALVNTYFTSTIVGGVTFVVTPDIAINTNVAIGAMYSPMALAYDERKAFNIRPQRDESREAWELNASLWFGYGVWRANMGVKITHDATAF